MHVRALLPLALSLVLLPACRSGEHREAPAERSLGDSESTVYAGQPMPATAARLLVRSASLRLETDDLGALATGADRIARDAGGYVESSSVNDERDAYVTLRVPAAKLGEVVTALEKLGDVESSSMSAEDVTDEAIDLDARLKNLCAVRDRLTKHLEHLAALADILAAERELARVQTEIDSIEGRLKSLRSSAALSRVSVSGHRSRILGPVGYVAYGAWWLVSKLFVIR